MDVITLLLISIALVGASIGYLSASIVKMHQKEINARRKAIAIREERLNKAGSKFNN